MSDRGYIELERTVDSITVGVRHRNDLGNIDKLMASIEHLGLLQPITIAPDGALLCGRRRLEAVKRLGWRSVRVWVRSGISDQLNQLFALKDENLLHKPFSPTEAAELYRELKQVMEEDAARRQAATRFGATADQTGSHGGVDSTPPSPGKTRAQASTAVTGADSHQRLERISEIQDVATATDTPEAVRQVAAESLKAIDQGASVSAAHQTVEEVVSAADKPGLATIAQEAIDRVHQPRSRRTKPTAWSARAFVITWTEMDGWWTHYNHTEIGPALSDADWELFERVLAGTTDFARAARRARSDQPEATAPAVSS